MIGGRLGSIVQNAGMSMRAAGTSFKAGYNAGAGNIAIRAQGLTRFQQLAFQAGKVGGTFFVRYIPAGVKWIKKTIAIVAQWAWRVIRQGTGFLFKCLGSAEKFLHSGKIGQFADKAADKMFKTTGRVLRGVDRGFRKMADVVVPQVPGFTTKGAPMSKRQLNRANNIRNAKVGALKTALEVGTAAYGYHLLNKDNKDE